MENVDRIFFRFCRINETEEEKAARLNNWDEFLEEINESENTTKENSLNVEK